jgi:Lon protease-like protein
MNRRKVLQLLAAAAARPAASFVEAAQDAASPEPLPLFPLPLVLLPQTNLPLHIFEERYKEMIGECLDKGWEFGILLVQDRAMQLVGCTASITRVLDRFPDGRMNILVRGRRRFEASQLNEDRSYLRGKAQFLDDAAGSPDAELGTRALQLYAQLRELAELENQPFLDPVPLPADAQLSYRMMAGVPAELSWKQDLLERRSEDDRLARVVDYLEELLEFLKSGPQRRPEPGRRVI